MNTVQNTGNYPSVPPCVRLTWRRMPCFSLAKWTACSTTLWFWL